MYNLFSFFLFSPGTPLEQQVHEDAAYVNMLAAECDPQQLFSCTTELLPPDISRQLKRNQAAAGNGDK